VACADASAAANKIVPTNSQSFVLDIS
jgi:hypothetical protein